MQFSHCLTCVTPSVGRRIQGTGHWGQTCVATWSVNQTEH